jgi:hypothetical protein
MSRVEPIPTRVALHCYGENRFFGHGALADLLGTETLTGLVAMAVTGRRPSDSQRSVLDEVATMMTSGDPRIWPLKLTRVVSSYGGTLAGFAAGYLALEGDTIGPWVTGHSAAQLRELREEIGDRIDDAPFVGSRVAAFVTRTKRVFGYGVPLRTSDERMDALQRRIAVGGRDLLPHWLLQEALSREMREAKKVSPNICVGVAALLLDSGFTPFEASALTIFVNQHLFVANAVEGARQATQDLRKLPDECVRYTGIAARESPRATARRLRPGKSEET